MCDEHGGNFNAIRNVYGGEFLGRTVTCQFHFRQCGQKQLSKINVEERETFKTHVSDVCYASVSAEYKRLSNAIEAICERNNCSTWWKWWHARRFHIVPAFRGFGISGLNMAEVGHSGMKTKTKMWLSSAAYRDTCCMMIQDREYTAYCTNTGKVIGKGPTLLQKQKKEQRQQRKFIQEACDVLESGNLSDIEDEVLMESDPSKYFLANKRSSHKAPENPSKKNPTQQAQQAQQKQKRKAPTKVTTKSKRSNPVYTSSSSDDDEDDDEEDDLHVPQRLEDEKLRSNPPTLMFINDQITICSGCDIKFKPCHRKAPKNIIFKYNTYRMRKDKRTGQWVKNYRKSPAYYHALDMGCIRAVDGLRNHPRQDIYMDNKTFFALTDEHKKNLRKANFWDFILRSRAAVTAGN